MFKLIIFFNSYTSGISGGDVRFIEITKRLSKKNIEILIITSKLGKQICEKRGLRARYMITTTEDRINNVAYVYFRRIINVLRLKLEIKDDIVLWSTSDFLPDVLPAFLFKRKNPKAIWIASIYHLIPNPFKRPGHLKPSNILSYIGQRVSLILIKRQADLIQTETLFLKNKLIKEYKIPSEKIINIQSGIDIITINNIINKVSFAAGKIYDACFLARLHPSKGIFDLVKAWKLVCEHVNDARLAIAGHGSVGILSELNNLIKSLNLERNIDVLGFLSEEMKYKLFITCKLYVLPSYEEGIPITFYEAMYCGLPVITYYLPTYEEIKNYIIGVPLGNIEKLSKAIIKLITDENLAKYLAKKEREFAKEQTWDKITECFILCLEKLIKNIS